MSNTTKPTILKFECPNCGCDRLERMEWGHNSYTRIEGAYTIGNGSLIEGRTWLGESDGIEYRCLRCIEALSTPNGEPITTPEQVIKYLRALPCNQPKEAVADRGPEGAD